MAATAADEYAEEAHDRCIYQTSLSGKVGQRLGMDIIKLITILVNTAGHE
jgi:hypothetical protein